MYYKINFSDIDLQMIPDDLNESLGIRCESND